MSDDKIAEIRARHLREDRWCYSPSPQMHTDRATLLAEIERLRAEVQRQTRHVEQLYDQIRRRADERDKAQIEVERQRADIERLETELALMKSGFEIAYRAMGDKP